MLQNYCVSPIDYFRLPTREVKVGDLAIGNFNPIRIQTMTTTDTMDTEATVAQSIRCIEAGAELVRITAPSKNEAENLLQIRNKLHALGYRTPLIADIHFTPNAAEIAARIVEKVRVNPGNYVDKKKFDFIEYSDQEYALEVERIRERFTPLVKICKEYGTAMRIGTNHGSLSDRIMSRFGDSPMGMVESAMEFLRIARDENYHQIILSMKSSNPIVMMQAYRLLVHHMDLEFGECYPLHLGVTEAGDGEDGRIKSAIGIGSLLEDGIGDTIRVSLTEDPEFEIPVCRDIVKRYAGRSGEEHQVKAGKIQLPWDPFSYSRRQCKIKLANGAERIGSDHVPVVVADFEDAGLLTPESLKAIGYNYDAPSDKWNIGDAAADYVYTGNAAPEFALPGTLQAVVNYDRWKQMADKGNFVPLLDQEQYVDEKLNLSQLHFLLLDADSEISEHIVANIRNNKSVVIVLFSSQNAPMLNLRLGAIRLIQSGITSPIILKVNCTHNSIDDQLIALSTDSGGLLADGIGDGIWLSNKGSDLKNNKVSGRTYMEVKNIHQFLNNTAFSILQATRTRISKTEYISCPSCGRTLFDLQETTAKIRNATQHLKGVKIAIMGCIVNGPGEMADADFGYVGSGSGKITLYKSKDIMKKNIPTETAVEELINLIRENGAWAEKE